MALDEDDPAGIGRDLGEVVAHAVVGGPGDGLGRAATAVVEGHAIEIVLDRSFVGIIGAQRFLLAFRIGILCFGAGEYDVFAVGTPHPIGLNVARVFGAGQGLALARGAAVPLQDAARGIEDLEEAIVLEVRDVIGIADIFS